MQRVEQRARKERLETERRQVRAGWTHLAPESSVTTLVPSLESRFMNCVKGFSEKCIKPGFKDQDSRSVSIQCVFCEQETLMRDLKRWCLAQLHSMEVRLTGEPSGTKLPHSSSAAEGADEDEGAGPTVPPGSQGTQPLDLHGPTVQLGEEEPSVAEAGAANHYFVVHVESSPGNQIHLNPFLSSQD